MKLLIISSAFPPMPTAPEADHAIHLCEHLAARGVEVHALTTKKEVAASAFPRGCTAMIDLARQASLLTETYFGLQLGITLSFVLY